MSVFRNIHKHIWELPTSPAFCAISWQWHGAKSLLSAFVPDLQKLNKLYSFWTDKSQQRRLKWIIPYQTSKHRCFLLHTRQVLLMHSQDTHRFFHWPETGCWKQDSALNGTSRKALAVHSHMTCHSLWQSVCVLEHEGWVRCFMSALLLLSSNTLQRWVSNASDLRHPENSY